MSTTPLISIVTPAYNAAGFIAESINSVIVQTYTHWEMIIVDDGSTDDTKKVVAEFAQRDSRIKYHYQQNGRQGKARNLAISKASGEYIAFLDADDLWVSNKLEKQLEVFEKENCDLVYTSGNIFEANIQNLVKAIKVPEGLQNNNSFILKQLFGYSVPILSVMVKKEHLLKVNGFDENLQVQNAEDYQLWIKLCDNGTRFYGLQDELFYYRVHANQATSSDSLALTQSIRSLSRITLKSVSERIKQSIMNKRVNRYLIHEFDNINAKRKQEIIKLYSDPLGKPLKYLFCSLLIIISKKLLLKYGYRFFDLSESI